MRVTPTHLQVGRAVMARKPQLPDGALRMDLVLCADLCPVMEAMMMALDMGWMVNLVGPRASGKTSLVRMLAALTGHRLREFAMNSGVDTMEILGGFEQVKEEEKKKKKTEKNE